MTKSGDWPPTRILPIVKLCAVDIPIVVNSRHKPIRVRIDLQLLEAVEVVRGASANDDKRERHGGDFRGFDLVSLEVRFCSF